MSQTRTIEHIVSQHAEEASFGWILRDRAVWAPHYSLADLAELDEGIEAHFEGLRVAGDVGWAICLEELEAEEPGEVFAAAVLALEDGRDAWVDPVLELAVTAPELGRALVSALGWLEPEVARPHIERFCAAPDPTLVRLGIGGAAVHRLDLGPGLTAAVQHPAPFVRARALRSAGELGRIDLLSTAVAAAGDDDPGCRFWGAWAAEILSRGAGLAGLRAVAEAGGTEAERAADFAARRIETDDAVSWIDQLARRDGCLRAAVRCAGACGDPTLAPWLIQLMAYPELTRLAGESFCTITGADLDLEDLEGTWPEELRDDDDDDDDEVAMDPDEDLLVPDPTLVAAWWDTNRGRFRAGERHLLGQPLTPAALEDVLRAGSQRHRWAAALELALAWPGRPLWEVRAPAARQMRALGPTGRPQGY